MALLYKQLSPLLESGKMEESSVSFWGCLSIKRTISLFGSGYREKPGGGTFRQPGAFKRAFRRGGKG